ncbi:hypothetical protein GGD55_005117 [Rhizobium giardinii]|uniref:Uncharacterized protein n=1 Tax=Rhizobium giardinii TaxID=56731 RepID=A0A7W8UFC5_9HYPH|nr:hypothetical protein [Rhizobium giardinii]
MPVSQRMRRSDVGLRSLLLCFPLVSPATYTTNLHRFDEQGAMHGKALDEKRDARP